METDRPCRNCGYNLRGLPTGGVCPECGSPILKRRVKGPPDELMHAPPRHIRLLGLGVLALSFGVLAAGGSAMLALLGSEAARLLKVAAIALWLPGVAIICAPRPAPPPDSVRLDEWTVSRVISAATQAAWLVVFLGLLFGPRSAPPGSIWAATTSIAGGIGLVGAAAVHWLLGNIAGWSNDPVRAFRMKALVWVMSPVAFLYVIEADLRLVFPTPFSAGGGIDLMWPLAIGTYAYALWSVLQLTRTISWARRNAIEARERDRRLKARFAAERAAATEREEATRSFGGPLPPV